MTLVRHLAAAVALGVLLVIVSVTITPFRDYQMAEVACYVVAVAGLTMLVGLSGQISLGNGAFMAIGAYAAALLLLHLHWPSPWCWWRVRSRRRPAGRWSAWPRRGCAGPTWRARR